MKKLFLLFVGLLLINIASAQFSIGPKIGYMSTKLSTDINEIESDLKDGLIFGAFVRLGDKFYIQPEINWYTSSTVFKRPQLQSLSPFEQEIKLDNIQIPLFVGVKLLDLKLVNLRATGGVTANFVVNKSISTFDGDNYINPIKESDINDIHWGLQVGAGVDVLMFTLDVQYIAGMSKIIETINIGSQQVQFDSKQGFVVTVGWKIL
ncbi:MAG: PorT family protein [Bacteroidetes bacterium]|jgi:hypothetical protein|nr:PorT family protein [Bacteroidota bacterium]